MKTRYELQFERKLIELAHKTTDSKERNFKTAYILGALHTLDWILNDTDSISAYLKTQELAKHKL